MYFPDRVLTIFGRDVLYGFFQKTDRFVFLAGDIQIADADTVIEVVVVRI